jgi:hypothetical protein
MNRNFLLGKDLSPRNTALKPHSPSEELLKISCTIYTAETTDPAMQNQVFGQGLWRMKSPLASQSAVKNAVGSTIRRPLGRKRLILLVGLPPKTYFKYSLSNSSSWQGCSSSAVALIFLSPQDFG